MAIFGGELFFNYNGISSRKFNILSVQMGNGMYEDTLTSNKSLNTVKTKNGKKNIKQSTQEEVISFSLVLAFDNYFTYKDIEEVVLWLSEDDYKPFYFEGSQDRIIHCMATGDSKIIHNGMSQGYITISMESNSSRYSSKEMKTKKIEVRDGFYETLHLKNSGHEHVYPEISILKKGAGEVKIEDLEGNIFKIINLKDGEGIYIDCERRIIESDMSQTYHYEDMIGKIPFFKLGINKWKITGDCDIEARYREEYKF